MTLPIAVETTASSPSSRSMKEIALALSALSLPEADECALSSIAAVCRSEFLDALQKCEEQPADRGQTWCFLEGLLLSCIKPTRSAIRGVGIELEPEDLVRAALFRPNRFRSAVEILAGGKNGKRGDAIAFLTWLTVERPWVGSERVSSPSPVKQAGACARESGDMSPLDQAKGFRPPVYRSHHVYSADFAMCFNASQSPDGSPSIMVDAASILESKQVDWAHAAHFMLDVREVGSVLAVFRRRRRNAEFKFHGKQKNKSFLLENQGPHFYCRVQWARMAYAVQILPHDALKVSLLFSEQLLLAYPHLPAELVLDMAMSVNSVDAPIPSN